MSGMTQPSTSPIQRLAISPVYLTPCRSSSSTSLGSSMRTALNCAAGAALRLQHAADAIFGDGDFLDLAVADELS